MSMRIEFENVNPENVVVIPRTEYDDLKDTESQMDIIVYLIRNLLEVNHESYRVEEDVCDILARLIFGHHNFKELKETYNLDLREDEEMEE